MNLSLSQRNLCESERQRLGWIRKRPVLIAVALTEHSLSVLCSCVNESSTADTTTVTTTNNSISRCVNMEWWLASHFRKLLIVTSILSGDLYLWRQGVKTLKMTISFLYDSKFQTRFKVSVRLVSRQSVTSQLYGWLTECSVFFSLPYSRTTMWGMVMLFCFRTVPLSNDVNLVAEITTTRQYLHIAQRSE